MCISPGVHVNVCWLFVQRNHSLFGAVKSALQARRGSLLGRTDSVQHKSSANASPRLSPTEGSNVGHMNVTPQASQASNSGSLANSHLNIDYKSAINRSPSPRVLTPVSPFHLSPAVSAEHLRCSSKSSSVTSGDGQAQFSRQSSAETSGQSRPPFSRQQSAETGGGYRRQGSIDGHDISRQSSNDVPGYGSPTEPHPRDLHPVPVRRQLPFNHCREQTTRRGPYVYRE